MKIRHHIGPKGFAAMAAMWVILLGFSGSAKAQQDPLYSQYMWNRMVINPAYVGSREQVSAVFLAREQWRGFDGGPSTQSFGIHTPTVDMRHGLGLSFVHDRVGFTNNTLISAAYAYRIPMGEGHLALGLNAGINAYWARLSQIDVWDPGDVSFNSGGDFTRGMFQAGPGIYYSNMSFYLGVSMPNVLPNRLYDLFYEQLFAQKNRHIFVIGGLGLNLGNSIQFLPSFTIRQSVGAPLTVDLTGSFLLKSKLWLGASWRMQNAAAFMLQYFITPGLRLGYAYDYSLTALRDYTDGTHELMLGIDFGFSKRKMINPRLF